MKICTYCDTTYTLKEAECPSCGASDFRIKCDSCNAIHSGDTCPNCGKNTVKNIKSCSKCGHQTTERICPICGYDSMSAGSIKDSVASVVALGVCKVSGHKWQGCKCIRCGEIRDDEHDFKPVANKCEEKCSVCGEIQNTEHDFKPVLNKCKEKCIVCGNTRPIPHNWRNGSCVRCGATMSFKDKVWESVGDKLPFLQLERKKNRRIFLYCVFITFSILLLLISGFIESTPDSNGKIRLPYVLSNFKDENFENAVNELNEDGFTNVTTVALEDLIVGWLNKEGEIASVKVGGTTEFEASGRYATDVEIVIEYHSFPKKESNETQIDESKNSNEDTTSDAYVYNGQKYEIVDSYETGIGLTQYWIFTSVLDYSTEDYKQKVKEIITDLVRTSKTTDIIVEVVTDKEIIYFESDSTIKEYMDKYGMDYYLNTIVPKENTHYIASYTGGYDSGESQLSKADSAYELNWFIATDSLEFEEWKPDLIP